MSSAGEGRPLSVAMIGAKGVPGRVGGVEKIVDELGARLAARGHRVTVYCRRHYSDRSHGERYRGMTLRWAPAWPGKYTDTLSHSLMSLVDALGRRYDVLHFHSLGTAPLVPLAWLAGARILFHIHGQEWKGGKWGRLARAYFKACEPVALDFAHEVVVNSRASHDYYREIYGRDTNYIPNAHDSPAFGDSGVLKRFNVTPRGYILFVGRLVPEKGCHYLVEACRRLAVTLPVIVVGEPAHSEDYAMELKRSAPANFQFAGTVIGDELQELYSRSLLVVNPTERDAVSLVLLEAMGQGACVLASDIPEMIEGVGGAGFHFRQKDPVDLARSLGELLGNPAAIESVREAARERVRREYAWEPVTDRFEALYRRLAT